MSGDPVVIHNNVFLAGALGVWHDCAGGRVFISSQQQLNPQLQQRVIPSLYHQQAIMAQQRLTIYNEYGEVVVRDRTKMIDPTFSLEEIEESKEFIQKLNADRQQLPAHKL